MTEKKRPQKTKSAEYANPIEKVVKKRPSSKNPIPWHTIHKEDGMKKTSFIIVADPDNVGGAVLAIKNKYGSTEMFTHIALNEAQIEELSQKIQSFERFGRATQFFYTGEESNPKLEHRNRSLRSLWREKMCGIGKEFCGE